MGDSGARYQRFEAPHWDEVGVHFEQLAEQEGAAVARAAVYFDLFSLQLLFALTPFD